MGAAGRGETPAKSARRGADRAAQVAAEEGGAAGRPTTGALQAAVKDRAAVRLAAELPPHRAARRLPG